MLPGRLGFRFALEALFLVALALALGFADVRPLLIIVVMAGAWVLVALVEFTAGRIAASPLSYLLPQPVEAEEEDQRGRVAGAGAPGGGGGGPPGARPPGPARG